MRMRLLLRRAGTSVTETKQPSSRPIETGLTAGVLCGAGAALLWAAGFVAIPRGLAAGLLPADIAFHRFVWTGLVLLPVTSGRLIVNRACARCDAGGFSNRGNTAGFRRAVK